MLAPDLVNRDEGLVPDRVPKTEKQVRGGPGARHYRGRPTLG